MTRFPMKVFDLLDSTILKQLRTRRAIATVTVNHREVTIFVFTFMISFGKKFDSI